MAYTEKQIQSMLVPVGQLYKAGCLNYRGKSESGRCYQEVCAGHLLKSKFPFLIRNSGLLVTRYASYKSAHDGKINSITNREEEHLAKVIFNSFKNRTVKPLGEMFDYQVPLKNQRTDDAGKIDLISYDGATLYLIELKNGNSSETLLRCMMEIATYAQVVDTAKLLKDYSLPPDTKIQATVLFPEENKNLVKDCNSAVSGAVELERLRKALRVNVCMLRWKHQTKAGNLLDELREAEKGTSGTIKTASAAGLYSFVGASITMLLP